MVACSGTPHGCLFMSWQLHFSTSCLLVAKRSNQVQPWSPVPTGSWLLALAWPIPSHAAFWG